MLLYHPECFAKTLEVYDLPGTQETNRIYNVRVFYDTKNVIVSGAGFLLCSHIFHKVSNRIAFGLEFTGILWNTTGSLWPYGKGVVNIVRTEARGFDFLWSQVSGKLVYDGCNHLKMGNFFCRNIGKQSGYFTLRNGIALGKIT